MDDEINGNLMTGILVAGIGMVLFMLFAAFWQLSALVALVSIGYGVYWLIKTGRLTKPKFPKRPTFSAPRLPKFSAPKLPSRSKPSAAGKRRKSKQPVG